MKANKKKSVFVCQFAENAIKVVKFSAGEICGLESIPIPAGIDAQQSAQNLAQVIRNLDFKGDPVIISLPRNQATCRYIKIPTQSAQEIENIVSLQASRYLPYPANELITGYQTVLVDKDGYSHVNLVIVQRELIERYIKALQDNGIKKTSIVLSSYGLCALYSHLKPAESAPTMLMDINSNQAELAIVSNKRVLFSRNFRLNRNQPNWGNLLIEEINKSRDVFSREVDTAAPTKVVVIGAGKVLQESTEALNKQPGFSVETLSYVEKVNISGGLRSIILASEHSFTSLVGLGLEPITESLDLLPQENKAALKKIFERKEHLRLGLFIAAIIVLGGLGIARSLDNKATYLKKLKVELNKVSKEAKSLEEIEKRAKVIESQAHKRLSGLDVLYELHQTTPSGITLSNLTYEEDNQIIMRGQAQELNSVFSFVSQLEKSEVFKNFSSKVKFATKKKTQAGELVDFEIACTKK